MNTENSSCRQTQQCFLFDTPSDLLVFLDDLKPSIIGQSINAIYGQYFYTSSDGTMPFIILDSLAMGISFYFDDRVKIVIADTEDFIEDGAPDEDGYQPIAFISKLPELENESYWAFNPLLFNPSCPVKTAKILDVIVDRHPNKFFLGEPIPEKVGDYFSSIRFMLEGDFELVIRSDYDDTFIGYSKLPKIYLQNALKTIPFKLDHHELRDLVEVTKISPDELAQEAITVIKRCAEARYWAPGIAQLLRTFYMHGMNPDYVSDDGDTILSVIPELGPKSVYTLRDFTSLFMK